MREAKAALEGATAPTVFQLRTNSCRKVAADMGCGYNRTCETVRMFFLGERSSCMTLLQRTLSIVALASLLASCQSTGSYKITLKDGRQYLCKGRPQFQGKTGYYRYRTFQDRDSLLRADEVLMIEEQGT